MIPVKLTLKNFLSYGEDVPPLDFTQFHLACLSGNNGQGKSALLDALTWAIWGEGRKSSQEKKADSSLLRIGQKNMQVELVFDLEGERYRIIRSFSLAKKGPRSSLEFQVFNQEDQKYVSLSGPSLKTTQEKIIQTLRIDYSTFINSAFILQGRIDEFSRKSARERKEILSEILGLSLYDELANLAKSHLKTVNNIIMTRESRLEYIEQEIVQISFYQQKIRELSASYEEVAQKIKQEEEIVAKLKEEINLLKNQTKELEELEGRARQQSQEIAREQRQIERKKKELEEHQKIISQKEKILLNFANYQKFSAENTEFTQKLQEIRKIEEEKILIERKIEKERADLTVELRNRQDRYKDFQVKVEQREKNRSLLEELKRKLEEIQSLQEESEKIRQEGTRINLAINTLKGKRERLEKDKRDSEEKLRLLRETPEGKCPLCETKLDVKRKSKIEDQISKEINSHLEAIEKLKKEEERLLHQKEKLGNRWQEINQRLKEKDSWQQKLSRAHLEYEESKKAAEAIVSLQAEIQAIESYLKGGKYARKEQEKLEELVKQIKAIDYNEERHRQLTHKVEELRNAPLEKAKLEEAEEKMDILREELAELVENQRQKELALEELKRKEEGIKEELKKLPPLGERLIEEEKLLSSMQRERNRILEERGGYQSKLEQCRKLEKEKGEIAQELEKSKKERDIYEKLILAFGKNGIQALIIENVLPEIEEEANNLLAKLTNNGTQITIESLRDLKSGGIKETLDIKISDELGRRDYELYSGGEAFRIDFALRIALSKLLTRRAGTRLRTLVIDEGFGTQDEEGIDNLIQAIQSISEDFDKILVITHLESLKNAFPVRIEVTKLPEIGSRYEIIKN